MKKIIYLLAFVLMSFVGHSQMYYETPPQVIRSNGMVIITMTEYQYQRIRWDRLRELRQWYYLYPEFDRRYQKTQKKVEKKEKKEDTKKN